MGLWTKLFGGAEEESMKRKTEGKIVTPKDLGIGLSEASLGAGKRLFLEFEDKAVVAQLANREQVIFALELLLFELVCKTLALVSFYGEEGYKASRCLAGAVLATFATNVHVADVPSFIVTACDQLEAHHQYYAQDICDLWKPQSKEDFNKKLGVTGIGGIGEKVLRKVLNPVLSISLENPATKLEAGQDFQARVRICEEAGKEWEKVPNREELESFCSIHAALSPQSIKPIFDEFALG